MSFIRARTAAVAVALVLLTVFASACVDPNAHGARSNTPSSHSDRRDRDR